MTDINGTIFSIQRFSIHDGPGIRTTVFFKGCPLRCFWCHNPEGLRKVVEIQFYRSRCIGCGECVRVCPEGAQELMVHEDGTFERAFNRERCTACGKCVETCYAGWAADRRAGDDCAASDGRSAAGPGLLHWQRRSRWRGYPLRR